MSADAVVRVVDEIVAILKARPQKLLWTNYSTTGELVDELRQLADRVSSGDRAALERLELFFAPTGTLETIALDSLWDDRFFQLWQRFEKASAPLLADPAEDCRPSPEIL